MSAYAELKPTVQRFVDFYVRDCTSFDGKPNATASYRAADPQSKSPDTTASRLLHKPEVLRAVEERMQRTRALSELDEKWVLAGLREVFERCMQRNEIRIKGVGIGVWEFDAAGAIKALELIGKHFAMFTDKLAGADGGPLQIQVVKFGHLYNAGAQLAPTNASTTRLEVSGGRRAPC